MNIFIYDFEVFRKLWLVVFINYETLERHVFINDRDGFVDFYEQHKDDIFVGYNSRGYDQFIFKALLMGKKPWDVNKGIIVDGKSGYQVLRNTSKYHLNNFDIQTGFHSLKQLEGFMGSKIKESAIDFTIERELEQWEIDEVLEYCIHDVEETLKVFTVLKNEYDSQLLLLKKFNLDMELFNKTKAQLAAYVLGAKREIDWFDEFELTFPDTIVLSEKYQYVMDWYKDPSNRNYKKKLKTDIAGVPHIFAWGGLHGAISNYIEEGEFILSDIESFYPAMMIEYDLLSRNVKNKGKYKEIRDERIILKKIKDIMQAPLKIVINATFGASKDQYNELFDPLMANNVCVAGQLFLLDLIDKIEEYGEIIQSNTDGILVKLYPGMREKYLEACDTWCTRTRLKLTHEDYTRIIQKDVNNYIMVEPEGTYKSKGAYVKKLSEIDYDLPILNTALINYFTKNIPIEDTINECNELREFQQISKMSGKYIGAYHGEKPIREKVLRIFASKDENDPGIFKLKEIGATFEKVPKTPEHAFIFNESVIGVSVPENLDRQHYIDMALKRVDDFVNGKSKVEKSDIKGVNLDAKTDIMTFYDEFKGDYFDFLHEIQVKLNPKKGQMEPLIRTNHFSKFGETRYLENYYTLFKEFWDNKNKKFKSSVTSDRVNKLGLSQDSFNMYGTRDGKKYVNISFQNVINANLQEVTPYSDGELIEFYGKYKDTMDYSTGKDEHRFVVMVRDVNASRNSNMTVFSLGSGKLAKLLLHEIHADMIEIGDIIKIDKMVKVPKLVYLDGKMVEHATLTEWYVEKFHKFTDWSV